MTLQLFIITLSIFICGLLIQFRLYEINNTLNIKNQIMTEQLEFEKTIFKLEESNVIK